MQINTLKDYKGGLRIIRGIAGTGKTIMATSLAKIWSKKYPNEKILFLVFNREIHKNIKKELKDYKNIDVQKLLSLVKCDINDLKNRKKENHIRQKLKDYLANNKPKLIIVDEAQDFPPYALQELRENISNIVVFIDESQAIYPFSTTNLKDAFPEDLRGKVRNLRTIYRVPEKILSLALQILNNDKSLNKYFKEIGIELSQNNSILEGGTIRIRKGKVNLTEHSNYTILSKTDLNIPNLDIRTYESVKGLEFDKVFLHDIGSYIDAVLNNELEKKLIWRKLYVAITRAKDELVIHNSTYSEQISEILDELFSYAEKFSTDKDAINNDAFLTGLSRAKSILFDLAKELMKEFIIRGFLPN
jgi:archaellum biogenesis ATPase FlaH